MKIVRAGVLPEDNVYAGRCLNCGCEVEVKKAECETSNKSGFVGKPCVKCPTGRCKGVIHPVLKETRPDYSPLDRTPTA